MQSPDKRPHLVVILGPTAVGKTEIAIQLAERLDGEIVSADSRTFYRGMDIGTAKPTREQQARVRHHLIDVADPDETWSLALFQQSSHKAIEDIQQRGKLPLLVGGTGQYLRAITEGWEPPKQAQDESLRTALEGWAEEIGPEGLHKRLSLLDPQAAAKMDARNLRRSVRALEVIFHTGERFSAQKGRGASPYRLLQLGLTLPREQIDARIDARIEAMLEAGLVEEVRALLAAGYSAELPSFSALGYAQIAAFLKGEISLDEAVAEMKSLTRQFVRRQANWFKVDDPKIHWVVADANAVEEMERAVQGFLTQAE